MDPNRLIATFIELADTLIGDYDVIDYLHMLTERTVELVGADAVGVLLGSQERLELVAASNEAMRILEQSEMDAMEGPCVEAYTSGAQQAAGDLGTARERWPTISERAMELGFRAVHAFPIRLREDVIGALNVYWKRVGELEEPGVQLGQALADMTAIGISQQRATGRAAEYAQQLQHALDARLIVEQAKGILAERHHVDLSTALRFLRGYARDHNLKLRDVARQITVGDTPEPLRQRLGPPI
jgi:GAF domain-containing protein